MVFHADGLAGIELHYAAQLTFQPVRGFENGDHHIPAAESALPAVNEPPADVPSLSLLPLLWVAAHVAFPIAAAFLQDDSWCTLLVLLHVNESSAAPAGNMLQKLHSCSITYIHTYIHGGSVQHDELPCCPLGNEVIRIYSIRHPIYMYSTL